MKDYFIMGGPTWMSIVTIFLIITIAWIIFHFVAAYNSEQANLQKWLRKLEYGKTMGLFTLITACLGQMVGLSAMFNAIEQTILNGNELRQELIFGGIKVTMIITMYGILIYLLTLLLWFIASTLIEKKHGN